MEDLLGWRWDILKKISETNLQNAPVMEHSFFILLLPISVNIPKVFSSFVSAVSETISLILNRSMG